MIWHAVQDIVTMALAVAGVYFAFGAYVRLKRQAWSGPMHRHHLAILLALVLVVATIKVSEDVLGGESGLIDMSILLFIHEHMPGSLTGFFEAVTFTGSSAIMFPLAIVTALALLLVGRGPEAFLVAASVIVGGLVVYVVKMAVGRARPALWDTAWYWGSSFPSGHTLIVAAFGTAAVLCVGRMRPASGGLAFSIALVWIALVALSRLVLGVHWPTDVMAAASIGAFLPLAMSLALEFSPAAGAAVRRRAANSPRSIH